MPFGERIPVRSAEGTATRGNGKGTRKLGQGNTHVKDVRDAILTGKTTDEVESSLRGKLEGKTRDPKAIRVLLSGLHDGNIEYTRYSDGCHHLVTALYRYRNGESSRQDITCYLTTVADKLSKELRRKLTKGGVFGKQFMLDNSLLDRRDMERIEAGENGEDEEEDEETSSPDNCCPEEEPEGDSGGGSGSGGSDEEPDGEPEAISRTLLAKEHRAQVEQFILGLKGRLQTSTDECDYLTACLPDPRDLLVQVEGRSFIILPTLDQKLAPFGMGGELITVTKYGDHFITSRDLPLAYEHTRDPVMHEKGGLKVWSRLVVAEEGVLISYTVKWRKNRSSSDGLEELWVRNFLYNGSSIELLDDHAI